MKSKFFWYILLFFSILLFLASVIYQKPILNIVVIPIAIVIYKYGDKILFKDYNTKLEIRKKRGKDIQQATENIINSGKLFKKEKF